MTYQTTTSEGNVLRIVFPTLSAEEHGYDTEAEARGAAAVVNEGLTWVGTPFANCAEVKGPNGAVDCAMLLARTFIDAGRLAPFNPKPYDPHHMFKSSQQHFVGWVRDRLGGVEVAVPKPGDVVLWQFGKCYSHGGLIINSHQVVHAYGSAGITSVSFLDEPLLAEFTLRNRTYPRPRLFFRVGA